MQIINNTRNDLLKRNEISYLVESEKNPSFDEMKKKVSEQVGKPEENIDVYNIKGNFGSKEFKINAKVYDSKEDLEKSKMKTKKQRDAEKKADGEAAKDVEEEKPVDARAPSEDKPEQVAQEDKPEEEAKAVKEEEQVKEETKEK